MTDTAAGDGDHGVPAVVAELLSLSGPAAQTPSPSERLPRGMLQRVAAGRDDRLWVMQRIAASCDREVLVHVDGEPLDIPPIRWADLRELSVPYRTFRAVAVRCALYERLGHTGEELGLSELPPTVGLSLVRPEVGPVRLCGSGRSTDRLGGSSRSTEARASGLIVGRAAVRRDPTSLTYPEMMRGPTRVDSAPRARAH